MKDRARARLRVTSLATLVCNSSHLDGDARQVGGLQLALQMDARLADGRGWPVRRQLEQLLRRITDTSQHRRYDESCCRSMPQAETNVWRPR